MDTTERDLLEKLAPDQLTGALRAKKDKFGFLNILAMMAWHNAFSKGFHEPDEKEESGHEPSPQTMLLNINGEALELWEAFRNKAQHKPCDKGTIEPLTNLEEEVADMFIRVLDFAYQHKVDLAKAVFVKMIYNASRPHMHGKTC